MNTAPWSREASFFHNTHFTCQIILFSLFVESMAVVLHHFIDFVSVMLSSLSEKNIRGDNITHEKLVTQSFVIENKWSHGI